jgi:hypothetical protein
MEIAVLVFVAVIIEKIVERLRADLPAAWVGWLNGTWVNLLAIAFGIAATYGMSLHLLDVLGSPDHAAWLDHILTGIALGFGAGFVADLARRSE